MPNSTWDRVQDGAHGPRSAAAGATAPRRRPAAAVLVAVALALAMAAPSRAAQPDPSPVADSSSIMATYYAALLKNTRWVETQWDDDAGVYVFQDFAFASVMGNAVLLEFGDYDAAVAGVEADVLRQHTLDTIEHYAASNRYNGGTQWGERIYWDATIESYFVAAARLLWDDLSAETRTQIDRIAVGEADYVASLEDRPDPRSGGWTTNGLLGGHRGDSKIEEMGAKTMPLAVGLASAPDHPNASSWHQWLDAWTTNMMGLPVADRNNPTEIGGVPVAERNTAQNVWPGYLVENHNSYAPAYHESGWVYPARNAVHFLLADQPLPESLLAVPNSDGMYDTFRTLTVAAGTSTHPMVADRYKLYGRDVLPLVGRHLLYADPYAARAERMLAAQLEAYIDLPPEGRLTKFSGEPKYEPEARAEVAIAYLLHRWRDRLPGAAVEPVSTEQFFADSAGTTDWGPELGLVAHQTSAALSVASTKDGYTKFGWLPGHDDWLFDISGRNPALLPSTLTSILGRETTMYDRARDGYDATATVVATELAGRRSFAGFTTLPDGSAVYATAGVGADEGALRLHNLEMAGVPGLDGDRTFHGAEGSVTLAAEDDGPDEGGSDVVVFPETTVRHVRMLGVRPATAFGYSVWSMDVQRGASGPDLALGQPTTASSVFSSGYVPERATDGDPTTRWAVSRAGRSDPASWLAVDLGAPQVIDRVELSWQIPVEAYRIQGSDDGQTWRDLAEEASYTPVAGDWLNIDDRAGFVVRGGSDDIRVGADEVTLSAGAAEQSSGMVVEAHPADAEATAAHAARPAPSGGPDTFRASLAGGHLSLFALSEEDVEGAVVTLPQEGSGFTLFRGRQEIGAPGSSSYTVDLLGASARVEAPRFHVARTRGDTGVLQAEVHDSRTVTFTDAGSERPVRLRVTSTGTGEARYVVVPPGGTRTVTLRRTPLTPVDDLATGRTTYPDSPLPEDGTDPDLAVDGDPSTAWLPGTTGRMVVDLGSRYRVDEVVADWTAGRPAPWELSISEDGLDWTVVADLRGKRGGVGVDALGRYVAVETPTWSPGDAGLAELSVTGEAVAPVEELGDGGLDPVTFAETTVRHVRMLGVRPANAFGYSIWAMEVRHGVDGPDLAFGQPTTASSVFSADYLPEYATDDNRATRWAVSGEARLDPDSWLAVDLGEARTIDRVDLLWDTAFGESYRIQGSDDGQTWRDLAVVEP